MQILRVPTAVVLKFTRLFMSFLEPRVSFPSNFASLFSVRDLTLLYFSNRKWSYLGQFPAQACKILLWKKYFIFSKKSQLKQTFYTFPKNFMNQPVAVSSPSLKKQKNHSEKNSYIFSKKPHSKQTFYTFLKNFTN